jgi:DNA-3-methyladenine glycosylase II
MRTTTIPIPEPFDFDLTVGHQTYFRGRAGADLYADGTYYRALRRDADVLSVAARPAGDGQLEVRLLSSDRAADLAFVGDAVAHLLAFDVDLGGFYGMLEGDEVLSGAVGPLWGLRPARAESVFEALVMAIVAQQISSVVARVIREGLVGTYGTPIAADAHTLHAFPTPESLLNAGTDELRAQKLSARKVEYIQDTAARTLNGELDASRFTAMDNEELIAELTKVRGIGRWTAEWVLMRALGRLDVLPAGDLALRRVVSDLYFDGAPITEAQLTAFGIERWSPYRGLATTYLFSYLRQRRLASGDATTAQPG